MGVGKKAQFWELPPLIVISYTALFAVHKALVCLLSRFWRKNRQTIAAGLRGLRMSSRVPLSDWLTGGSKLQPWSSSCLSLAREPRTVFTFLSGGRKIKRIIFCDTWNYVKFRFLVSPIKKDFGDTATAVCLRVLHSAFRVQLTACKAQNISSLARFRRVCWPLG